MGTLTQGMFLASEAGQDEQLPSFFEVFMQDRINQSLKPALKYVVMVLMERYALSTIETILCVCNSVLHLKQP